MRGADKRSSIHDYWHKQADLFSKLYRSWNPMLLANRLFLARRQGIVREMMEIGPETTALDVGCGSGELLEALRASYPTVFGCDYSRIMLEAARSRLAPEGNRLFLADALKLPVKENRVDHLYALGLFDYLDNAAQGLSECCRVMKKGGCAVLTFPKSPSLFEPLRWSQAVRKALFQIPPILNVYSRKDLQEALSRAGFVIEDICSLWTTMWIVKIRKSNHGRRMV